MLHPHLAVDGWKLIADGSLLSCYRTRLLKSISSAAISVKLANTVSGYLSPAPVLKSTIRSSCRRNPSASSFRRAARVAAPSGLAKIQFIGERDFKSEFSLIVLPVTRPMLMEPHPHAHDFDIYLTFYGHHPDGMKELGGEVEFYIGKEQEKYVFTTPTSFFIPKGTIHCPLHFKVVNKPIMLVHATLATKYVKAPDIKLK